MNSAMPRLSVLVAIGIPRKISTIIRSECMKELENVPSFAPFLSCLYWPACCTSSRIYVEMSAWLTNIGLRTYRIREVGICKWPCFSSGFCHCLLNWGRLSSIRVTSRLVDPWSNDSCPLAIASKSVLFVCICSLPTENEWSNSYITRQTLQKLKIAEQDTFQSIPLKILPKPSKYMQQLVIWLAMYKMKCRRFVIYVRLE